MSDAFQTVFAVAFIAVTGALAALPPLVVAVWLGRRGTISQGVGEAGLWTVALFVWFAFALFVTRSEFFGPTASPLAFGFLASFVGGISLGWMLIALHPTVRRRVIEIPIHWPVGLQTARLIGGAFLVWAVLGAASWPFALIAGLGDIVVGGTAPFVARAAARDPVKNRGWIFAHALLGLIDFASAITTAVLLGANLSWPAHMIPTFLVPLAILMHIWVLIALWRTRGATAEPTPGLKLQRS